MKTGAGNYILHVPDGLAGQANAVIALSLAAYTLTTGQPPMAEE